MKAMKFLLGEGNRSAAKSATFSGGKRRYAAIHLPWLALAGLNPPSQSADNPFGKTRP